MESEEGENRLEQNLPEKPPPEYNLAAPAPTQVEEEHARGSGEGAIPNVKPGTVHVLSAFSSLKISAIYLFSVDSVLYTILWKTSAVETVKRTKLGMCNFFLYMRRLDI